MNERSRMTLGLDNVFCNNVGKAKPGSYISFLQKKGRVFSGLCRKNGLM